jgi:hypothetical protein
MLTRRTYERNANANRISKKGRMGGNNITERADIEARDELGI